jgi:hypothetical protein
VLAVVAPQKSQLPIELPLSGGGGGGARATFDRK